MKNGPYILVKSPDSYPGKKYRNLYCYEHHLVWWINTSEIIDSKHVIHHVNEVKTDNRYENLKKQTKAEHCSIHGRARKKPDVELFCGNCRSKFTMQSKNYQTRLKNSKSKMLFCSRSCQIKKQHKDLKLNKFEGSKYIFITATKS